MVYIHVHITNVEYNHHLCTMSKHVFIADNKMCDICHHFDGQVVVVFDILSLYEKTLEHSELLVFLVVFPQVLWKVFSSSISILQISDKILSIFMYHADYHVSYKGLGFFKITICTSNHILDIQKGRGSVK